jgi:hypothetical protein
MGQRRLRTEPLDDNVDAVGTRGQCGRAADAGGVFPSGVYRTRGDYLSVECVGASEHVSNTLRRRRMPVGRRPGPPVLRPTQLS